VLGKFASCPSWKRTSFDEHLLIKYNVCLLNTALQAATAESVLTKFENSRQALLESLHQVEETIPEAIGSKVVHDLA